MEPRRLVISRAEVLKMVEFRVQRLGLERRWIVVRIVAGREPLEVGRPYEDPILAMEAAKELNRLALRTNRPVGSREERE